MTGSGAPRWVGIAVSKAQLDVALLPQNTTFRVRNDAAGWQEVLAQLDASAPPCIVLEATSVYHVGLTLALAAAGFPAAVMNPEQTHAFIRSEGQRTKTDRTDARLLARFGQQKQPAPSPVLTETTRDLKELVACREDFTQLLTMEKNRRQVATDRTRAHHQALIDQLLAARRAVDTEIAALIAADTDLTSRQRIRQSVPGIGAVLAPVLLAGLTELGHSDAKGVAALAGVAPHTQQSGTRPARGGIRGGRAPIRKALYQMAQTAVVHNGVIAAHDQQLRQRMSHKPAIIACARRMLGILNAMLRDGLRWEDTKVGQGQFLAQHP